MKVRDALVRVHHRQLRSILDAGFNIGFDFFLFVGRQTFYLGINIAQTVIGVDSQLFKSTRVLFKHIGKNNRNAMTKDDRIRNFHHSGLHMQR